MKSLAKKKKPKTKTRPVKEMTVAWFVKFSLAVRTMDFKYNENEPRKVIENVELLNKTMKNSSLFRHFYDFCNSRIKFPALFTLRIPIPAVAAEIMNQLSCLFISFNFLYEIYRFK